MCHSIPRPSAIFSICSTSDTTTAITTAITTAMITAATTENRCVTKTGERAACGRLFHLPLFLTQKLLPLIKDGGGIVNPSSGLARFALPGSAAYGATKGPVGVLTRYLVKELGPRSITANVVAPGAM